MKYRTVLFDLDGTLVDSAELILRSWRHTMRVHFGEAPPDEDWLETLGMPLRTQFRRWAGTPAEVQAMIDTYVEHNLREHPTWIRPFRGVRSTLWGLTQESVGLGIVTSKAKRGAAASLAACGIDAGLFGTIVTSDEPVPHKPDPAPVRLALERLGEKAERAVFVGDSIWDIRSGRGAGVATAAALWGPFPETTLSAEEPTHSLSHVTDLLDLASGAPQV